MRILYVTLEAPWPARNGGRRRFAAMASRLGREHQVLCLFPSRPGDPVGLEEAARAGVELAPVRVSAPAYDLARRVLSLTSDAVAGAMSPALEQAFKSTLEAWRPDVVQFGDLALAGLRARPTPVVVEVQALATTVQLRRARLGSRTAFADLPRAWRHERTVARGSRALIALSEAEAATLARWYSAEVILAGNGTDAVERGPSGPEPRQPVVLYVGSLDYEPNIEALLAFLSEGWPALRVCHPGAEFRIVGRRPDPRVARAAARAGAELVGEVADVSPHLREAAVVALPLRIGAGTRTRILEVLAAGRVVVTTPLGAEGLNVGPPALVRAAWEDLPAALAGVLAHPERRRVAEEAAPGAVIPDYDWGRTLQPVLDLYRRLEREQTR
jgi:glycosyltransferase involved in cell wall biosynthesis